MKIIEKDKVIYSFSKKNPMIASVKDGETFWVDTDDCYNGQITNENILRPDIDISIMDCSVGPIEIIGSEIGDTLCIEIIDIELASKGVMVTSPGLGVLGERIKKANTKIIPIIDGYAHFSDEILLPLTPMIGVLGVIPKKGDIHCAIPDDHGGNLDTKLLKIGTKVYLPVAVSGAGLAIGDLHACMGDGELSGTGIEIAGKVCLKTTLFKDKCFTRPLLETSDGIYTISSNADINEAIKGAVSDMVDFLMDKKSLSFPDAYRLLSATCDIQISQLVNENKTVRVKAPKKDLKICSIF